MDYIESPILDNSNTTTIVDRMPVFTPATDLPQIAYQPSQAWVTSLESVAPTITEKLATQAAPGESWDQTLQRMLPILAMTYQQREILQIQLERARAGLPPLSNADFGAQVSVGLDPQTRTYLIVGGAALIGLLFYMGSRGRRS